METAIILLGIFSVVVSIVCVYLFVKVQHVKSLNCKLQFNFKFFKDECEKTLKYANKLEHKLKKRSKNGKQKAIRSKS